MLVTESGIVTDVMPVRFWNAYHGIEVTPSGITTSSTFVPPKYSSQLLDTYSIKLLRPSIFSQPAISPE